MRTVVAESRYDACRLSMLVMGSAGGWSASANTFTAVTVHPATPLGDEDPGKPASQAFTGMNSRAISHDAPCKQGKRSPQGIRRWSERQHHWHTIAWDAGGDFSTWPLPPRNVISGFFVKKSVRAAEGDEAVPCHTDPQARPWDDMFLLFRCELRPLRLVELMSAPFRLRYVSIGRAGTSRCPRTGRKFKNLTLLPVNVGCVVSWGSEPGGTPPLGVRCSAYEFCLMGGTACRSHGFGAAGVAWSELPT